MRPPLSTVHKAIVGTQVVLAILFGVMAVLTTDSSDEWADLARVAAALLAGFYLLGVVISTVVARFAMRGDVVRGVTLLFGPFVLATAGVVSLQWW